MHMELFEARAYNSELIYWYRYQVIGTRISITKQVVTIDCINARLNSIRQYTVQLIMIRYQVTCRQKDFNLKKATVGLDQRL